VSRGGLVNTGGKVFFTQEPREKNRNMTRDHASRSTFLTNHAHVLLCLADDPSMLMRDIAVEVGITERAVQRIIRDLREEGYIEPHREGRRNTYEIDFDKHLKHPIEKHRCIMDLIRLIYNKNGC